MNKKLPAIRRQSNFFNNKAFKNETNIPNTKNAQNKTNELLPNIATPKLDCAAVQYADPKILGAIWALVTSVKTLPIELITSESTKYTTDVVIEIVRVLFTVLITVYASSPPRRTTAFETPVILPSKKSLTWLTSSS